MKVFSTLLLIILIVSFSSMKITSQKDLLSNHKDSLQADRDKYINELKEKIKGKESMMVDSVFSNLKVLGGFPAENLLHAMNSWSRALGVSCTHCHVTNDWSLDTEPEKEIARQMSVMTTKINSDLLKNIKGLKSVRSIVNCTSCHNGKLKPALRITD